MKIRILGWRYRNIRRMEDLEVDLTENGKLYPNSLIMMSNGTGKTTTLSLIRAVFSGSAETWRGAEVRTYRPAFCDAAEGSFYLKVQFDQEIYHYILHLDYEEGKAWYETSSAMMEGGYEEGRRLPYSLRDIFRNEEFVNRFVFDGEQAKKTLNSASREAENAILYLYQLDKLDDLSRVIDKLAETRQEQNTGGNTLRSVRVYKGKEERRRRILEELRQDQKDLERRLSGMRETLQGYEREYQKILDQNSQLKQEADRLEREKEANQDAKIRVQRELMQCIRKPYNLQLDYHTKLKTLVENMQVLKLPKNTAREFFKELAAGNECLCGRAIGEKERRHILERADEYLGADSLVVVNAIKSALHEYQRDENAERLEEQLRELMTEEVKIAQSGERLILRMEEDGDEEMLQAQKRAEHLKIEIQEAEKQLDRLTAKDSSLHYGLNADNNIPLAQEAWEEARENYLRSSGTYQFIKKAERMKQYLKAVQENAMTRLKQYMVEEINRKIEEMIRNDTVLIKKIDGHLVLEGKDGASEGQTLAIAYAFLGTLFEHSRFEFPFIVDSPAAPMDLPTRRVAARILPELFGQTVIMVTSGEKNGFGEKFYGRPDVCYLTIKGEKGRPVVSEPGEEFFREYQEKDQ